MTLAAYTMPPAVFFFQAEDGIRGGTVTGVQTCALPIWSHPTRRGAAPGRVTPRPKRTAWQSRPARAGRRSEERRVGKRVDRGGCRSNKMKKSDVALRAFDI